MTVTVRWPDGRVEDCYSPSLVMHDHLEVGASYPVAEFVERTTTALAAASERVRQRFGVPCTAAATTTALVRRTAAAFAADQPVQVLRMHPACPRPTVEELQ